MEVILLERIENLGLMGDVVRVKPGYARNYLLPQHKAISATPSNRKKFEMERVNFEATSLKNKKEADKIGKKINGVLLVLVRQAGDGGQLYGSVNARDVANELKEQGFNVNRNQVSLDRPIKSVGLHPIKVSLHPEVIVDIKVNIARSIEEAKIQEKTGEAVISNESDEQPLIEKHLAEADDSDESHRDSKKSDIFPENTKDRTESNDEGDSNNENDNTS